MGECFRFVSAKCRMCLSSMLAENEKVFVIWWTECRSRSMCGSTRYQDGNRCGRISS